MKRRPRLMIPVVLLVTFTVLMRCECPTGPYPRGDEDTHELTLSDGTVFQLRVPAGTDVTCQETVGFEELPAGCLVRAVTVEGTLPEQKTGVMSFSRDAGFNDDCSIAFLDGHEWVPVYSQISDVIGGSLAAQVNHLSVWTVIDTSGGASNTTISGTINFSGLEDGWRLTHNESFVGSLLRVTLFNAPGADANPPLDGPVQYEHEVEADDQISSYSLTGVPAGSWLVTAYIDMDGDGILDSDEPHGAYVPDGGGALVVEESGADMSRIDISLKTVLVSGSVTLADALVSRADVTSDPVYLFLMREAPNGRPCAARFTSSVMPRFLSDPARGAFTIQSVPSGLLYAAAFIDATAYDDFDHRGGQPFGVWADNVAAGGFVDLNEEVTGIRINVDRWPPRIDITSHSHGTPDTMAQAAFAVSGTVVDPDGPQPETVEITVYRSSDVDLYAVPPAVSAGPVVETAADVLDSVQDPDPWTVDINLSSYGNGDYVLFADVPDELGLSWYDYVVFTVEAPTDTITIDGTVTVLFDGVEPRVMYIGAYLSYVEGSLFPAGEPAEEFSQEVSPGESQVEYAFIDIAPGSYMIFGYVDMDGDGAFASNQDWIYGWGTGTLDLYTTNTTVDFPVGGM